MNGNQALGSALDLPDQNHRHSLAAAIKCGSDLPGFPRRSTTAPPLGGDARTSHSPYLVRLSLSPVMSPKPYRCLGSVAVGLTLTLPLLLPPAARALLFYSAAGSSISGSLGGVDFTDASWQVSGTADETQARNTIIPIGPPGSLNLWSLPVSPRVTITAAGSSLEAELLPDGDLSWIVLSGTFPIGPTPKIGFVYTTASFFPETAAGLFGVPGLFTTLQVPFAASGPSAFEVNTYPTTAGPLVISSFNSGAGVFRIQPVPGPLPLFGLAAAGAWSRRLRRSIKATRRPAESCRR